jgi:hypothetical protein
VSALMYLLPPDVVLPFLDLAIQESDALLRIV